MLDSARLREAELVTIRTVSERLVVSVSCSGGHQAQQRTNSARALLAFKFDAPAVPVNEYCTLLPLALHALGTLQGSILSAIVKLRSGSDSAVW